MKKSLIALATLAATGTAFSMGHSAGSSVTLSGKFGVSYFKTMGGVANMGVTDGDLRFVAVEDMGGGLRATADMELRVRGRAQADDGSTTGANDGVGGRNATVGLSGGFGSLTLGSIELANGIKARAWAGAPIGIAYALEQRRTGGVLGGAANADTLIYTTPELMKGLRFSYIHVDDIGTPGATKGVSGNAYQLNYAQGPLSMGGDYTKFENVTAGGPNDGRTRVRVSGSYNLGAAVLGVGYEKNKKASAIANAAHWTTGIRIPVGAVTLGAVYVKSSADALATNANKGYALAAEYALSKRTAVNFTYVDQSGSSAAAVNKSEYQLRMMHSF